jgi:transcriptional regulator with XRE-family HTH domain
MLTLTTGEKILILRKRSGLTQIELAARAGVGRLTVHGVENGYRKASGQVLESIASTLGVDAELLASTAA